MNQDWWTAYWINSDTNRVVEASVELLIIRLSKCWKGGRGTRSTHEKCADCIQNFSWRSWTETWTQVGHSIRMCLKEIDVRTLTEFSWRRIGSRDTLLWKSRGNTRFDVRLGILRQVERVGPSGSEPGLGSVEFGCRRLKKWLRQRWLEAWSQVKIYGTPVRLDLHFALSYSDILNSSSAKQIHISLMNCENRYYGFYCTYKITNT
jgi:hypothetical protein